MDHAIVACSGLQFVHMKVSGTSSPCGPTQGPMPIIAAHPMPTASQHPSTSCHASDTSSSATLRSCYPPPAQYRTAAMRLRPTP